MKKLLLSIASALGLAFVATPTLAAYISDTGKTVITPVGQSAYNNQYRDRTVFAYFSQVGDERISGQIEGRYGRGGSFDGWFSDASSNGDVCEGTFSLAPLLSGKRMASWRVTNASSYERCRSIGQEFTTQVYMPVMRSANGTAGTLADLDPVERLNVRQGPSIESRAHSYGLAGDRVWIEDQSGAWYKVRFQKGGTIGWIHRSLVISDATAMN